MIKRFQNCAKKTLLVCILLNLFSTALWASPQPAAHRTMAYVPKLKGKKIALVVNNTSTINHVHLVDTLLSLGVHIKYIFAPEHGFRGNHGAGELVSNEKDAKTGLPIISLYGKNRKPTPEQFDGLDLIVFDIQDVGVRFYTYISTMHYVMETCAETNVPLLILDRPNPNGHYVDGPLLKPAFKSFVGMHPIPVVHGLTVGELALMINGERWLKNGDTCKLEVIKASDYAHSDPYILPIAPSPNLPNQTAIYLYPSICFFEGADVSLGRGTNKPFQIFGFPNWNNTPYTFTPRSIKGVADNPPLVNEKCNGFDLSMLNDDKLFAQRQLTLNYLLLAYHAFPNKNQFFNTFFDKLAGTDQLRKQIIEGKNATEIRQTWTIDLMNYQQLRKKYLLYPLWR